MNVMFKKILCLLAALAVMVAFGVFAMASGEDGETEDQGKDSASSDQEKESATKDEKKANLGDYNVEIKSCRLAEDYLGKPVVIVTYTFTNYANDAEAFYVTIEDHVYQDGIGLNESYVLADSANYSSDNQMKEIKTGASLDVEVAYELNDSTTDIEVEVEEYFSFTDKKVTKTFSIAD